MYRNKIVLVVFCIVMLLAMGCEKNKVRQKTTLPSPTTETEVIEVKSNAVLSDVSSETATTLRIADNVYLWDKHWKIEEDCNQDELSYQSHFSDMPKLEKIEIIKSGEKIEKPSLQKIETMGYQRLSTDLSVKDKLLMCKIPAKGVYGCLPATEGKVRVPKGTEAVFDNAFWDCDKITSVSLDASVKWIGNGAFGKMSSCKKIEVSEKNPYIMEKKGAIYMKDGRVLISYPAGRENKTFVIPNGVEYIADGAFAGARNLQWVVLPSSVKYIGYQAFDGCTNLEIIKNMGEERYKFVASNAFQNCQKLQTRISKIYHDESYVKNWHGLYPFLDEIETWDLQGGQ